MHLSIGCSSVHLKFAEAHAVACQELFAPNDFVDELLCSVGAGTSSCANACAIARAAVYGASPSSSIPRSIQFAKFGTWGEQVKNVDCLGEGIPSRRDAELHTCEFSNTWLWAGRKSLNFGVSAAPTAPQTFHKCGGEAPRMLEGSVGPPGPHRPPTSKIFGRPKSQVLNTHHNRAR